MSSSSSSCPTLDPATTFYCPAGTPSLSCTLTPYLSSLPSPNYFPSIPSPFSSPPSIYDLLDYHSQPVRRVFSAGDLTAATSSPDTNSFQDTGRVHRYTAEERIKRIERYRNKRNHRNFHKKITYACRKTLADSRPRVRGRFARNGELETETEPETSETSYESYNNNNNNNNNNNLNNSNHCGSSYLNNDGDNGGDHVEGDWFMQMQTECCYDEDVWASLDSVFSMNILS